MEMTQQYMTHNPKMVSDSLMDPSSLMPNKIWTTVHDLVKLTRKPSHIEDRPTIACRRQAPRGCSIYNVAIVDGIANGVGSLDISRSELYFGSYSTWPSYDPHGYDSSVASYLTGCYPVQLLATYRLDFTITNSQSMMAGQVLNRETISGIHDSHPMGRQEYAAILLQSWSGIPCPNYDHEPYIYKRH